MKNWIKDVIKWYGDRDCKYEIINDPGAICHDLLGFRNISFGHAYFKIISYENNSNKRFAWRFTSNRRKS